jgi:dephospho-CoA kinase
MMIDRILVVDIDEQTQRQRVMQRDNLSVEQVNQILDAQVSRIERLGAADDILLNNHGLEHLQEKVAHYHGVYSLMATEGSDAVPA